MTDKPEMTKADIANGWTRDTFDAYHREQMAASNRAVANNMEKRLHGRRNIAPDTDHSIFNW